MNRDMIEGNWRQFRGKVKEQWGKLTNNHLERIRGRRDRLVGKIQQTYGCVRDAAARQVRNRGRNR